jgi:hypothetical protein
MTGRADRPTAVDQAVVFVSVAARMPCMSTKAMPDVYLVCRSNRRKGAKASPRNKLKRTDAEGASCTPYFRGHPVG